MNDKRALFWTRFGIYVLFQIVVPITFLVWRFKLFQKISTVSIGGWGIVVIILVTAFFVSMIKYVKKGLPFSFLTQCLNGIMKTIIPLIAVAFILNWLKGSINELSQFVIVYILCQIVAIPANPFPKWVHDNNLQQEENKTRRFLENLGIIKPKE
jgi:hypothetical protein